MNIFTWLKDNLTGELDDRDVQRFADKVQGPRLRISFFGVMWTIFILGCVVWLLGMLVRILSASGSI